MNLIYKEALRKELIEDFWKFFSLPLQVSDSDQARKPNSTTQSIYPKGAVQVIELAKQGKHKTFKEAIGRATESYQVTGNTSRKGCQLADKLADKGAL